MKTRNIIYLALLLLAPAFLPYQAQAQIEGTGGTAGAAYLLVPSTARVASLGGTLTGGLPDMNGLEALTVNPAGLVSNPGTSALFSRMNYVADIGVNTFGIGHRLGNNQLALVVNAWDFGDMPLTTETSPEISSLEWSASAITVGASFARQFTDRIAAGITTKLLNETIDDMSATGVAFDAGMNYTVGETGLRFGVSLNNFGLTMKYAGDGLVREIRLPGQSETATSNSTAIQAAGYELPSLLNFGASYTMNAGADASATFLANFQSNSLDADLYSGALELSLRNILYVRGGYQWQENMDLTAFKGWNLGAGLRLDAVGTQLMVDYAYRPTELLGNVQMITASVAL